MLHRKRRGRSNISPSERIELFLRCVKELQDRRFVHEGLTQFNFQIKYDEKLQRLETKLQEADQEDFRSFLLTFRKLISNNEEVNVDRVLNICIEFIKNEQQELREVLKELKTVWGYGYRNGFVQMQQGGRNLTPEYVLDLWINGSYFHDDPDKRQQLIELMKNDLPSVKIQLLWSLPILTRIILHVGALVSQALEDKSFDFSKREDYG